MCLLSGKQLQLNKLRQLNTQAEKNGSRKQAIGLDLQRQFAQVIVELDDINKVSGSRQSNSAATNSILYCNLHHTHICSNYMGIWRTSGGTVLNSTTRAPCPRDCRVNLDKALSVQLTPSFRTRTGRVGK